MKTFATITSPLGSRRLLAVLPATLGLLFAATSFAQSSDQPAQETTSQQTPAQTAAPAGEPESPMSVISRSADEQLAESVAELNRLRTAVAAEKLPLSQKLTELEERVTALRKENEALTKSADQGKFDTSKIAERNKKRQEELTYIANILDEYARGFDGKVNICEMQHLGEQIEKAKQVMENTSLTESERFARQIEFVNLSIKRVGDLVGGTKFAGVGVDLQSNIVKGDFAIIGPIALFRAESGSTAGLVVPQTGSTNPLIRPLEGPLQVGLAALVQGGEGLLPFDPSRGGALKQLVQKTNIIHIFEKGGPIMWPLLAASVLALGTVLERLLFLFIEKFRRDPRRLEKFFAAVGHGDLSGAEQVAKGSKFPVLRALGYALSHRESSLPNALLYAQSLEMKRFRRGISVLDTVITLAPLLGLLGTVTGMMGSFSLIGGELSAPGAITGGIAEALIATAFGLGIAITALLPFNYLNARIDEARHEIESASAQLELLVKPSATIEAKPAPVSSAIPSATLALMTT
jgi:biopolymer transport protein ExbB